MNTYRNQTGLFERIFTSYLSALNLFGTWASFKSGNLRSDACTKRCSKEDLIHLHTVKRAVGGNALNKAGRLVLRGNIEGQAVKVYEAASLQHAQFIQSVCTHTSISDCFPHVDLLRGQFLKAEWVPSATSKPITSQSLACLLHLIHGTQITELPKPGFDYWRDFVVPRFIRAASLLDVDTLALNTVSLVDSAVKTSPRILMHPDLTATNVILGPQQSPKIIDNELMTIGGLPLLDVCNAAQSLGASDRENFVALYLKRSNLRVSGRDVRVLEAAWLARTIGARFVAGDLSKAQHILRRYARRQNILPFSHSLLTPHG